jgi:hypothetical protein
MEEGNDQLRGGGHIYTLRNEEASSRPTTRSLRSSRSLA